MIGPHDYLVIKQVMAGIEDATGKGPDASTPCPGLEVESVPFEQCSNSLLVDDELGDYTTLHILGIKIIQNNIVQ